jgi:hypothetical protein
MSTFYADIDKLRAATQGRQPEQKQFLLKKLYKQLAFVVALGVSTETAHDYADTFERYHPEEIWPRRMLRQIVMTASAPDESVIQQAFQHFTTPGTANYFKALYDLYQGTQTKHLPDARLGFLVSAAENSITAQLVELYFGGQPGLWETYRAQGPDFTEIALAFWTDERVIARDAAAWDQLAARIVEAYERTT